jgi:hypothetical protein
VTAARKFRPEPEEAEKAPGMDLSLPLTIAELIAARARIVESWHECNQAIKGVDAAFARIHDPDFHFITESQSQRFQKRQDPIEIKEMTADLDYSLYVFALGKLNITNAMTEMAKDRFLASIKEKKTVFDETQLMGLAQNAGKLFRDSSLNTVREVYRKLIGIGYSAPAATRLEKKKDNLQKVEKVFRVGWSDVGLCSYGGYIECRSWRCGPNSSHFRFNDLLTACRLIDGEGIPDYSNNLNCILNKAPKGTAADVEYFTLQAYKNGNVKVNWNEDKMHILDKLNAIGSGRENAMPDTMRKRYKSEHFHGGGAPKAETFFNPEGIEPSDEKDFAFYPTPSEVADRMVALAEYGDKDLTTLEPSAGDGQILDAIPWDFGSTAVEFNHHRALKIKGRFPAWHVDEADFLKWQPGGDMPRQFDRVLMNPPFNDRVEAYHIVKAFGHLAPGGILVAILPEGWFTRDDQKSTVLRSFLQEHEHKPSETLPAGTFSRTRIVTRIVTLKKP